MRVICYDSLVWVFIQSGKYSYEYDSLDRKRNFFFRLVVYSKSVTSSELSHYILNWQHYSDWNRNFPALSHSWFDLYFIQLLDKYRNHTQSANEPNSQNWQTLLLHTLFDLTMYMFVCFNCSSPINLQSLNTYLIPSKPFHL